MINSSVQKLYGAPALLMEMMSGIPPSVIENSTEPVVAFRQWDTNGIGATSQDETTENSGTEEENGSRSHPIASDQFYKTKCCIPFARGRCRRGEKCCFAHGDKELRNRVNLVHTKLCERWMRDTCDNPDCGFAHGEQELRSTNDYFKISLCKYWKRGAVCEAGSSCRHAHGETELRTRKLRKNPKEKGISGKDDGESSDTKGDSDGDPPSSGVVNAEAPPGLINSKGGAKKNANTSGGGGQVVLVTPPSAQEKPAPKAPNIKSRQSQPRKPKRITTQPQPATAANPLGQSPEADTSSIQHLIAKLRAEVEPNHRAWEEQSTANLATPPPYNSSNRQIGAPFCLELGLQQKLAKLNTGRSSGNLIATNNSPSGSPVSIITTAPSSASPMHRSASTCSFVGLGTDMISGNYPNEISRSPLKHGIAPMKAEELNSHSDEASTMQAYLASIVNAQAHGAPFNYRSDSLLKSNRSSPSLPFLETTLLEEQARQQADGDCLPNRRKQAATRTTPQAGVNPLSRVMSTPHSLSSSSNLSPGRHRLSPHSYAALLRATGFEESTPPSQQVAIAPPTPVLRIVTDRSPTFTSASSPNAAPFPIEIDGVLVNGYIESGSALSMSECDELESLQPVIPILHGRKEIMPSASSSPDLMGYERLLLEQKQKQSHQMLMQSSVSASNLLAGIGRVDSDAWDVSVANEGHGGVLTGGLLSSALGYSSRTSPGRAAASRQLPLRQPRFSSDSSFDSSTLQHYLASPELISSLSASLNMAPPLGPLSASSPQNESEVANERPSTASNEALGQLLLTWNESSSNQPSGAG
eukprot:GHVN01069439.1.p2 GENE.GHVN01069439.1~~GHVN01069439.1.p2  ORF type:complete len:813 (-),score=110.02 GHVN01069439.1:3985-6423(-)